MKLKSLLLLGLGLVAFLNAQHTWAQTDSSNIPLMLQGIEESEDKGKFFLERLSYLETYKQGEEGEDPWEEEGSEFNEWRKTYLFWKNRLPTGTSQNPWEVYSNAVNGITASSNTNCAVSAGTFNGNWKNVGPIKASKLTDATWFNNEQSQGRIFAIYSPPGNPSIIYAGAKLSGVWKTIDGGKNWTNITDGFLPTGTITCSAIAANPTNPSEMYIGTNTGLGDMYNYYGHGIWKTTDGGNTWAQESSLPATFSVFHNCLKYCPYKINGQDMVIALSWNQIWQKIGTGAWTNITPSGQPWGISYLNDIEMPYDIQGKMYVSTTWTDQPFVNQTQQPSRIYSLQFDMTTGALSSTITYLKDGTQYINDFGVTINTLYSPPTCSNCTAILTTGLNIPVLQSVGVYKMAYAGGGKLYILAKALYISTALLPAPFNDPTAGNINKKYGSGSLTNVELYDLNTEYTTKVCNTIMKGFKTYGGDVHTSEIEASPNNSDVVYVGLTQPIKIYKDIAANWQKALLENYGFGGGNIHADIRSIYIASSTSTPSIPGSADILFWGTDGGISKSQYFSTYNLSTGTNVSNTGTGYSIPSSQITYVSTAHTKFESINGNGLIIWQGDGVDVSPTKGRKISTAFDNGITYSNENMSGWSNYIIGYSDGYDSEFDKRDCEKNVAMFSSGAGWNKFEIVGNNSNNYESLNWSGNYTNLPKPSNGIDVARNSFTCTSKEGLLYLGNKNVCSTPNPIGGSNNNWNEVTFNGVLHPTLSATKITTSSLECKAFANTNTNVKYFVSRNIGTNAKVFYVKELNSQNGNVEWVNKTSFIKLQGSSVELVSGSAAIGGGKVISDLVVDDKNGDRVFISFGGVGATAGEKRVLRSEDRGQTWVDMSAGLTTMPVNCMVYQAGSDDIIYAGTDAGIYRWDKPLNCWVKFNTKEGSTTALPTIMPNGLVTKLVIDYCSGKLVANVYGRGIWESKLYMPNNLPGLSTTIQSSGGGNTIWNTSKALEGSVLIKAGNTLTIQGTTANPTTIYMPKYGRIYVEKGAKLIVDGAKITNGCGTMWVGIEVFGASSLHQQQLASGYYNQGYLELKNNAIIENAENAIANTGGPIWNAPASGNTGGIIVANNAKFYNNRRSVQFNSYNQVYNNGQLKDASNFTNCLFEINDNYPKDGPTFVRHASLYQVRGVKFETCNFKNLQTTNFASNPAYGHEYAIYALNASYEVLNLCTFEGFYKAISSASYSWQSLFPVRIENSQFINNEIGLHLASLAYPSIKNNTFLIGKKQTVSGTFSIGSKLESVSSFFYSGNTHNRATSPYLGYLAGTEVYNTGTGDQQIDNNNYSNLTVGNDAAYVCGSTNPSVISGLNYRCNTNTNNYKKDFVIQGNPAYIRKVQCSGTTGTPLATENVFSAPSSAPTFSNWSHSSSNSNAPVSYYYGSTANENPSVTANVNLISGTDAGCTSSSFNNSTNAQLESIFNQHETAYNTYKLQHQLLLDDGSTAAEIAAIESANSSVLGLRADLLSISPFVSQEVLTELALSNVMPQSLLLEILLANPSATQNNDFVKFLSEDIPNPLPPYMISLIEDSWNGNTTRDVLELNIAVQHEAMTNIQIELLNRFKEDQVNDHQEDIYTWVNKVKSLRSSYELIEILLYGGDFSNAETMYESLPQEYTMSEFELGEYQLYGDLYNFKKYNIQNGIDISQLSTERIATLTTIADNPYPYFPRSMARGALCFFYDICYPDEDRSEVTENVNKPSKLKTFQTINDELVAYPNPAKDYVTFYFNLKEGEVASELTVMDLNGRLMTRFSLSGRQGQQVWDIQNVKSGNYIYGFKTVSGTRYTGKLTVQK